LNFDEAGFLSEQINQIKEEIYHQYKKNFDLCYEVSSFAEKVKYEFHIHPDNGQEVITACLFIRLLETYQAAIVLIERGFDSQVKAMIRMLLETLMVLKICCDDEKYIREYVRTDEKNRQKIMNIALKYEDNLFSEVRNYATQEIKADLDNTIKTEGITDLVWERIAAKADMSRDYDSVYRYMSMCMHTTPRELETYLDLDSDNDIASLNHLPRNSETKEHLMTVCDYMCRGVVQLLALHKLDHYKVEMKGFFDRFNALYL
jgi:hypothetical protein